MATLVVENVTKTFGSLVANDRVSLTVESGSVLAVLGENGAGKSTLMRVIAGLLTPDRGTVSVDGRVVPPGRPDAAIRAGIGMIHQHFMLVPRLTVWENVVLGHEPRQAWGLDRRRAVNTLRELSERYGLAVDPEARVANLTVGQQQRVEILKAFYRGAQVLILDEPTALLTPQETEELFRSIRHFTAEGLAVVFISHKLDEVMHISERVTVIRRGQVVGTIDTAAATPERLAEMMVGRQVVLRVERSPIPLGSPVLEVENLVVPRRGQPVGPVSFTVAAGEVLGVAGIEGNGQHELVEALVGLERSSGSVRLGGVDISRETVRQRLDRGLRYVPADRHGDGLVLDFRLDANYLLRDYARPPFRRGVGMDWRTARARVTEALEEFDIRPRNPGLKAAQLSGGNQQKLILARELREVPRVLIVSSPTRGLDVGATEFVHRRLLALREQGTAILLVSLELEEILTLADHIIVAFRGRFTGKIPAETATQESLGLLMAGQAAPSLEVHA
jgi:ABC-type uncharacterized transport system ATPase subunit